MRRILTFALLAALALAASVPVSLVTAGKAQAQYVAFKRSADTPPHRRR